jgi:hypothetical protein
MRPNRLWMPIVLLSAFVGIGLAATSSLGLLGSDTVPTEIRVQPSCFSDGEYVPIVQGAGNGDGNGNSKLTAVEVRGVFSHCAGSQMEVIVALTNGRIFYAVTRIEDNSQVFTFRFDVHDGDFTDRAPSVVNGVLTSQGSQVPPPPKKQLSDIQALVSDDWN